MKTWKVMEYLWCAVCTVRVAADQESGNGFLCGRCEGDLDLAIDDLG